MLKYQSFTYQHFKKVSYQNDLLQTRDLSTPNVYDLFFLLRRIELFIYTSFISTVICTGRFPYIYRYCYFTVVHLTVEKKLRALIIGSDSSAVDTTIYIPAMECISIVDVRVRWLVNIFRGVFRHSFAMYKQPLAENLS